MTRARDVANVLTAASNLATDTETAAAISTHAALSDPHAEYLKESEYVAAGKNKIINGDFGVNQRNFTSTTTTAEYNFDRWRTIYAGGTTTTTAEVFALGTAPVAGCEGKNYYRMAITGQATSTNFVRIQQNIESVRTFAGQTVNYSFWAKASAGTPKVAIISLQAFGNGGSPSTGVLTEHGTVTLSTSWVRYSVTCVVPSISGKTLGTDSSDNLSFRLLFSAGTDVSGHQNIGYQNVTFDTWGHQAEAGNVMTPFTTASGTIGGELALCQRYYYRTSNSAVANAQIGGIGFSYSTTNGVNSVPLPVTMRSVPHTLDYAGLRPYDITAASVLTLTSAVINSDSTPNIGTYVYTLNSTTANRMIRIDASSSSGYLGFSAET